MSTDDERREHTDRVINALLDSMRRNDMRAFADQWAPDGAMEFPFAPPGYPRLESRAGVWDYVKDYSSSIHLDEIIERARHHTLDPTTVVLEFSANGTAVQTGGDYRMDYISVVTVGPAGVTLYKDYWNSLVAAAAMGGVDALMGGFGKQQDA